MCVTDPPQHISDKGMTGVEWIAGMPVGACDGGDLAPQRRSRVALTKVGQVIADLLRTYRHWGNIARFAPERELLKLLAWNPVYKPQLWHKHSAKRAAEG